MTASSRSSEGSGSQLNALNNSVIDDTVRKTINSATNNTLSDSDDNLPGHRASGKHKRQTIAETDSEDSNGEQSNPEKDNSQAPLTTHPHSPTNEHSCTKQLPNENGHTKLLANHSGGSEAAESEDHSSNSSQRSNNKRSRRKANRKRARLASESQSSDDEVPLATGKRRSKLRPSPSSSQVVKVPVLHAKLQK